MKFIARGNFESSSFAAASIITSLRRATSSMCFHWAAASPSNNCLVSVSVNNLITS